MASKRKRSGSTTKIKGSPAKRNKPVKKRSPVPTSKSKPARKGFSKVARSLPSRVKLEAAEEKAVSYLNRWQERWMSEMGRELDSRVLSHINKDGSVHAQLLLATLPRGVGAARLTFGLSETEEPLKGGFWISTTMRFTFEDDEQLYRRFKGMQEVTTYPQDMGKTAKIDLNLSTARGIMEKVKRRRRVSARQIAVNVIWTHDGRRPAKRKPGEKVRK